jgi:hypothetical protein
MDVFSLSWRQGDRKMLQNSCQEKERSEKTLNADTIGHSQRRGCTFPVPDAKGWCKKQQKSSGFKRIVIKNSSIKIFRHGLGESRFAPGGGGLGLQTVIHYSCG